MDIPSRIGKYKVLKHLGQGASGCVLKVQQDVIGRNIALKILFTNLMQARPNTIKRFKREARLASSLIHPNIVLIFDIGEENGMHYYTMQYVEGLSMVEQIKKNNLSFSQRLDMMLQFCDALALAHSKGIIHRDLKPHNVVITKDLAPMILDFGIAKSLVDDENMTQVGHILGSAHYMAPEQARSTAVGTYTDVFGIGVMMYEMFTGARPFQGNDVRNLIIERIKYGEDSTKNCPIPMYEINNRIPIMLNDIVFRCMAGKPKDRYQTANEVLEELKNFKNQLDLHNAIDRVLDNKEKDKILVNHKASYVQPILFSLFIFVCGILFVSLIFWGEKYIPNLHEHLPFLKTLQNY
ncbi:serine/threonine protein kinase [Candidatus Uabimicrobium sp. HlEnr_7]|uniref:serine/threonine protein kinase n=1 Tax=Candidatus Uabimicrobium helgolandensis TaxID=3095367 RepID=UPI003558045C